MIEIKKGKMYVSKADTIVLATNDVNDLRARFSGVVVHAPTEVFLQVGDYSESFSRNSEGLREFKGEVSLNTVDLVRKERMLSGTKK